ncbi:hypothetical protein DYP60_09445 [Sphaerochaeta halotolerans]|uniref:Uncharacterized protein n=1 Tax=Sphaerochaeta halotolerans TaxID=2293840 RepID=A0A372MF59_9SPIR|nr:hypothetical protein [Sphaerochaeta halotolerans]RFU94417.1 hypothetical protein DYP60_09445 [Sphaerochaeta halotolerans]
MKKTIAILLVLVIGMAGVFAAELDLTTNVAGKSNFKITVAPATLNNYGHFLGLTSEDSIAITFVEDGSDTVEDAYLTMATNVPYSISMSAEAMETTNETLTNAPVINYTVTANNANYITNTTESAVVVRAINATEAQNGMIVVSHKISAELNQNDYFSAATGGYTGVITFNITAE